MPLGYWKNKFILITGASSGLGLHIAKAFGASGAHPILVARNESGLSTAKDELQNAGINCDTIAADVCDAAQARNAVRQVIDTHGSLDVLVNNVGKSTRVKVTEATANDYQSLFNINFLSAVNCTIPALEYISESSGHIVNIGSLASKTAWPYMAPYSASKFALAAFNHQLRLELPDNVHVLLVCPGPIRRDDAGQRYSNENHNIPETALAPGGGAKLTGIDPEKLATRIVQACKKRRSELVIPAKSKFLFSLAALNPRWGDWIVWRKNKSSKSV